MGRYLSILATDHFGHVDDRLELGLDPGFLHELAASRIPQCLSELDMAAGQAPYSFERLFRTLRDQHLAIAPYAGTDPESWKLAEAVDYSPLASR